MIKNINTNIFCIKFRALESDISHLKVTLNEERYYYTLYDKNSLDIFDLKPGEAYHISLETIDNNLFFINYDINEQNVNNNDNNLPLKSMIIYEDKSEFSSYHLSQVTHTIKVLSESFLYLVSESKAKYLSLYIEPRNKIKKFSFAYNRTKDEIIVYNLKNNTLFNLSWLHPYDAYKLNINSKILEMLEYEITIKYSDIRPFDNIYLIENPSRISKVDRLSFKKVGNYLKANSSFINTQCDTKYTSFLIKSYAYLDILSIKVKVIGDNFYYLTKEVKTTIELLISKKDYYFANNCDKTLPNVIVSINIKYKPTKDLYFLPQIYYSTESKSEFKLEYDRPKYPSWRRNGNEYNSTIEFDFTTQFDRYINFDILLLKIVTSDNLNDFRIEYKYVDKVYYTPTENKSNTWIYIVCPIGAVLAIVTIATSAKFGCKKNSNSNLIEDNIDADANLMPQENHETHEIQEKQETINNNEIN